jgi:hypothetical protein
VTSCGLLICLLSLDVWFRNGFDVAAPTTASSVDTFFETPLTQQIGTTRLFSLRTLPEKIAVTDVVRVIVDVSKLI